MRQGFRRPSGAAIEDEGRARGRLTTGFAMRSRCERMAPPVATIRGPSGANAGWRAVLDGERSAR